MLYAGRVASLVSRQEKMMSFVFTSLPVTVDVLVQRSRPSSLSSFAHRGNLGVSRRRTRVKAFFFNPIDESVVKQALKEPVAFMGGMFAGLLRLDLNEDPLKEWVTRTVEASGITDKEIDAENDNPEEIPQQIEIE